MDLEALSWDALLSQKEDLQARLARFQQAFHQKHGRNPAGEELSPAKPAIKRYRAVCKEISLREQEAAQLYAAQQTAAGVPKYLQKSKGGGAPIGELAANGAQSAAMTSNIAVSGGAVERAMTRAQTGRIAAGADERGASAAGAAGGANTGAMQASVDGMQAGGAGASGGGLGFSDLLPSTATVELIANGLQYMQLSYTLLAQVRGKGRGRGEGVGVCPTLNPNPNPNPNTMLSQGAAKLVESVPGFDIELNSPWTIHWCQLASPTPTPTPTRTRTPTPTPTPIPNPNPTPNPTPNPKPNPSHNPSPQPER